MSLNVGGKVKLSGELNVIKPKECACCGQGRLYIYTSPDGKVEEYYCQTCFDSGCTKCNNKTFKS